MSAATDAKYAEVMEAAHKRARELGLDEKDIMAMLAMDLAGCLVMAGVTEEQAGELMRACFERARKLLGLQ